MKKLLALALAASMTVSLASCGKTGGDSGSTGSASSTPAATGEFDWRAYEGTELNVLFSEHTYADAVKAKLNDFQDLTGIKVNYTTFDSNESLYAKMKSGGASYDVIVPSEYMVGKMIAENMLAELDYDNIPNMANIGENYLGWSYDPDNTYSVPYTWGTTGIIYNTTMVEEPPTSWADLWDVEYAGNVLMFNNSRDAYAIAAKKMGLSLNPSSVEEVDDVMKELQAQKSVVQAYVMDEIFDKEGGEAAMAPYYAGDALTMIDENPDLAFVSPEEGVNFFVDSMCIPASSKHKEAAEMFINFMCEPDVGYQNCDFIGYSTPITEVWERLDDDLKYSPIAYPSDEVMNKAEVFVTLPDDINAEMDAKWSEMKSYDESGSGWLIVVFLLGAIAISGFNIWRKMRKKVRDNY